MVNTAKDLSPKSWEALCVDWLQSGLPQKDFCKQRGISYKVFVNWRGRNKEVLARIAPQTATTLPKKSPPPLIPIQVLDDDSKHSQRPESSSVRRSASSPITITTCAGHRLQVEDGFNEQTLLRVLRTLKEAA